jgi:hypothetical protein
MTRSHASQLFTFATLTFLIAACPLPLHAQQTGSGNSVVPALVNFSGVLTSGNGEPLTNVTGVTFSLYAARQGGSPLWMETQNVEPNQAGQYSVMLGSTNSQGLPSSLFVSGQARWLEVQPQGQEPQPRIMLLSVPYALKAGDAQTVGGLPPSAFTLVGSGSASSAGTTKSSGGYLNNPGAGLTLGGTGKAGYIAKWLGATTLGDSALFQNAGDLGISTVTPSQKLEIDLGNLLVKGVDNFQKSGDTASLYVGDTNHPVQAIYASGLALGAYKVPQALFIQDSTGNVGIGTTAPASLLDVNGSSSKPVVTVTQSGSGNGIAASTSASTGGAVYGLTTNTSCFTEPCSAGILGQASNIVHVTGVMGIAAGRSKTGLSINNGAGIWGDTNVGVSGAIPVLGTTDDNIAVVALNNGVDAVTLEAVNFTTQLGETFYAAQALGNSYCYMDTSGDLVCTGSKSAVVPLDNGRKVKLYAVEAPENWFEDFGASELHNGEAVVALDPAFTQTIDGGAGYHVFLTPKGDCKGLYVGQETPGSFEVRELGGGTSNISFDYRITARRKGYERVRLEDVTERVERLRRTIPSRSLIRTEGSSETAIATK